MKAGKALLKDQLEYFAKNYSMVAQYDLSGDKIYIGSKKNRKCRFCGKSNPESTFKHKSHALPEMIGNKLLFSYDECDQCNSFFAETLEDNFAKYLSAIRTLSSITGKKGIPTFKTKDRKLRIEGHGKSLNLDFEDGISPFFKVDTKRKRATIDLGLPPFIPTAIYKLLVKMALSIMPVEELDNFQSTLFWIRDANHKNLFIQPQMIFQAFMPGDSPFESIKATLLKRLDRNADLPFMYFVLTFKNYFLQIFLPSEKFDARLQGKTVRLMSYPIIELFGEKSLGKIFFKLEDFADAEIEKNATCKFVFHFDEYIVENLI